MLKPIRSVVGRIQKSAPFCTPKCSLRLVLSFLSEPLRNFVDICMCNQRGLRVWTSMCKTLDNNDLNQVGHPAVLVKTRVWVGCSVLGLLKPALGHSYLRFFLGHCRPVPMYLLLYFQIWIKLKLKLKLCGELDRSTEWSRGCWEDPPLFRGER